MDLADFCEPWDLLYMLFVTWPLDCFEEMFLSSYFEDSCDPLELLEDDLLDIVTAYLFLFCKFPMFWIPR